MDTKDKSLEFMQIAMKYIPEAKEQLEKAGIELSLDMLQPFLGLLTKVMSDAYELGKQEAKSEE
ncbi:ComZ family protein [Bacillus sp. 03113]|uniref:ComZ family protein n=1 Tax=Bacillus sp. 03113 TaxID=2578211 RepID=UPI00114322BF|nr:ComZ family protein [Bacillus sp. 03113]